MMHWQVKSEEDTPKYARRLSTHVVEASEALV